MRRRLLIAALLGLFVFIAGCSALSPGGDGIDREALGANETYTWETSADVTVDVQTDHYEVVVAIENRSTVGLSAFERLNERRPLGLQAVAFRYPNGTVVRVAAMSVETNGSHTRVTLPASDGQFAYRVAKPGKAIHMDTPRSGTYEVLLPPETHVRYPLLGRVQPDGYETSTTDGRVHLRWADLTADQVTVEYYLVRDLFLFAGLVALGLSAGAAVLVYFWLQLRRLRERRQAVDLEDGE